MDRLESFPQLRRSKMGRRRLREIAASAAAMKTSSSSSTPDGTGGVSDEKLRRCDQAEPHQRNNHHLFGVDPNRRDDADLSKENHAGSPTSPDHEGASTGFSG